MLDDDLRQELLLPASKLTHDIARSIGSPKRDVNDLKDLEKALNHMRKLMRKVRKIQLNRYSQD